MWRRAISEEARKPGSRTSCGPSLEADHHLIVGRDADVELAHERLAPAFGSRSSGRWFGSRALSPMRPPSCASCRCSAGTNTTCWSRISRRPGSSVERRSERRARLPSSTPCRWRASAPATLDGNTTCSASCKRGSRGSPTATPWLAPTSPDDTRGSACPPTSSTWCAPTPGFSRPAATTDPSLAGRRGCRSTGRSCCTWAASSRRRMLWTSPTCSSVSSGVVAPTTDRSSWSRDRGHSSGRSRRRFVVAGSRETPPCWGSWNVPRRRWPQADALVLLSRVEGLPQVLVQAAAAGTPFVSYEVEIVVGPRASGPRGGGRRLVPSGDLRAAAVALTRVLSERCSSTSVDLDLVVARGDRRGVPDGPCTRWCVRPARPPEVRSPRPARASRARVGDAAITAAG